MFDEHILLKRRYKLKNNTDNTNDLSNIVAGILTGIIAGNLGEFGKLLKEFNETIDDIVKKAGDITIQNLKEITKMKIFTNTSIYLLISIFIILSLMLIKIAVTIIKKRNT